MILIVAALFSKCSSPVMQKEKAHLLSTEGKEESECMPVWSEEGTPMLPAIWFIWLVPD